MTIDQIKTAADTNIRVKTADNSVTRDEVADLFDNLADEQRDRGIFGVDTTAGLAAISGANYRKVAVGDTGIFEWASTGTANGTTIFAASGGGVWILKMAIPKGSLASLNSIDYTTNLITNKPDLTLKADLVSGKVPANQLPSYVDDVLEYANLAALPGTGEAGKIYITIDTGFTYRWTGSVYLQLTGGGATTQKQDSTFGFSLNSSLSKNDFLVYGSAILRPTSAFTNGSSITWVILEGDGHSSLFFTSAEPYGNTIIVRYPKVKVIYNVTITPDEVLAKQGLFIGPSVGLSYFTAYPFISKSLTVRITGTAAQTLDREALPLDIGVGLINYPTFDTSTGILTITGVGSGISLDLTQNMKSAILIYNGSNRLSLKRIYSGVASNELKYYVYDSSGALLSSYPVVGDEFILNLGNGNLPVLCDTWYTNYASYLWSDLSNFWAHGVFEAWMVVKQNDISSNKIIWQNDYPSATNYKIYRSNSPNYTLNSVSGMTLIHTGNSGEYIDNGLASGTLYYYKLMATVGSDVEVTTFNCKSL